MKCLSNCDEINATICKTAPFSRKYFVSNVVSRLRIFNLLFTRITGYYLLKVFGKDNRRLAIASFLCCTSPTRNSNSDLGYLGLELEYHLELLEKRSLNFVGFKLA
jgi:hypothetical protein